LSQSPQTGQFNSYKSAADLVSLAESMSLNPLKRVNSILTFGKVMSITNVKNKVSIPSNGSIQFLHKVIETLLKLSSLCLNPLKRVNSILTFRGY